MAVVRRRKRLKNDDNDDNDNGNRNNNRHAKRLSSIPIVQSEPSWIAPCLAIVLCLIVAIILFVVTLSGVWFVHNAGEQFVTPLSNAHRIAYIVCITIVATLISAFVVGQIRTLWLRYLFRRGNNATLSLLQRTQMTVLVGQGSLAQHFEARYIFVTLLISGLITTTIVSGLAISNVNYQQAFTTQLATGSLATGLSCLAVNNTAPSNNTLTSDGFIWTLANGSTLSANLLVDATNQIDGPVCPSIIAKSALLDPAVAYSTALSVYMVSGVSIDSSAIGVTTGSNFQLKNAFSEGMIQGSINGFQKSINCLPVMTRNPVSCSVAGKVTTSANAITVSTDNCTVVTPIYAVDPRMDGATAAGACTHNLAIGQAQILLGAANSHVPDLVSLFYNSYDDRNITINSTFAVSCTVNIAPTIAFRELTLGLTPQNFEINPIFGPNAQYRLTGDVSSDCTAMQVDSQFLGPSHPLNISAFMSEAVLATAASASLPFLSENAYSNGRLTSLILASTARKYEGRAFNNSQTVLEDILGLASGVALGAFWGTDAYPDLVYIDNGISEYVGLRVGSGHPWNIVFVIPPLFAGTVLAVLWFLTTRKTGETQPESGHLSSHENENEMDGTQLSRSPSVSALVTKTTTTGNTDEGKSLLVSTVAKPVSSASQNVRGMPGDTIADNDVDVA